MPLCLPTLCLPINKPVYIGGVNKSGRAMIADRVGDFSLLNQKVYYHLQAVGNILSFSNVKTKLELKYINDTFVPGTPDGDVVFRPYGKLYVYSARGDVIKHNELVLIETVKDNEAHFTKRVVRMVKEAREMQKRLGFHP